MSIKYKDIKTIFFPKNSHEKYKYLGSVPWNDEGDIFKAMEPLIIYMDAKAKPWWCPRWVLRFLHLFGNGNSVIFVRNRWLHNLYKKITKGYLIVDYKTKWSEYDLRISIYGDDKMNWIAEAIEEKFHNDGYKEYLKQSLTKVNKKTSYNYYSIDELKKEYKKYYEQY